MGNTSGTPKSTMLRVDEVKGIRETIAFLTRNREKLDRELWTRILVLYKFAFPANMTGHNMVSKASGRRVTCVELGERRWRSYQALLTLMANAEHFLLQPKKKQPQEEQKTDSQKAASAPCTPSAPPPEENPGEEGETA
jgi:hypothetical protein